MEIPGAVRERVTGLAEQVVAGRPGAVPPLAAMLAEAAPTTQGYWMA